MVEPTESESKYELDRFCDAMWPCLELRAIPLARVSEWKITTRDKTVESDKVKSVENSAHI